jgi:hypothetical protein
MVLNLGWKRIMPIATVAAIIVKKDTNPEKILLTCRNGEPFKGMWCLPVGFLFQRLCQFRWLLTTKPSLRRMLTLRYEPARNRKQKGSARLA